MALAYENYVWRLQADNPVFDLQLPQDLEWVDESTWTPIAQKIDFSLTGALIIQEHKQLRGRPITLQGKDDMAWIQRPKGVTLMQMRDIAGLVMNLQFVAYNVDLDTYGVVLFDYDVMFRHYEPPPLELESVLRFDNFETTAWYKVRNIKFMETIPSASTPCTANITLSVSGLVGSFSIGETVTGSVSGTTGTVMGFSDPNINLFVYDGAFQSGETITGPFGSAIVV